jgi:hypothetical protein
MLTTFGNKGTTVEIAIDGQLRSMAHVCCSRYEHHRVSTLELSTLSCIAAADRNSSVGGGASVQALAVSHPVSRPGRDEE